MPLHNYVAVLTGSERLRQLAAPIEAENKPPPNIKVKNRSASAPKQRSQSQKVAKRSSAPNSYSGRIPLAEIKPEGKWTGLQEDLLVIIVQKLSPAAAAAMRLVLRHSLPCLIYTFGTYADSTMGLRSESTYAPYFCRLLSMAISKAISDVSLCPS